MCHFLKVPVLTILEAESQQEYNPPFELTKVGRVLRITLKKPLSLKGDVRVILKNKPNVIMMKEKMFHFWFNTYFVKDQALFPPSPSSRRTLNEKNDITSRGLDSTVSLTRTEGLALKNRWIGSLIESRPERSSNGQVNHLSPNALSSSSR